MEIWIFQNLVHFTICVLVTCFLTSTKAQGDVSCDFEKGFCGWAQDRNDEFDWTRITGKTDTWWTGPDEDHTSGDGYYIYIETNAKRNDANARLNSPQVEEGKYCITFWYSMYGEDVNTLNVYMRTKQKDDKLMFSRKGGIGENWNKAHISMDFNDATFQIAIEGVSGNDDHGDIAVDDILLKFGLCSDCNFDDGLCEWTQEDTDDFDWTVGQYETTSRHTGPEADHTSKNGSYLHIDASGKHNEDTARITSPQLDPGQHCFKFWYRYGLDINALNVYTKINGNIGIPILALKNNTGSKAWGQAHIYIQSTHYYQIVIEGVAGDGYMGDIAIDDIVMHSGVCLTDTVTTTTKATSTTLSISPSGSFTTVPLISSTPATTVPSGSSNTENEGGSLTAVYVLVPVVVIILVAIVVSIYLRRCAKHRSEVGYLGSVPENDPPPVFINDGYLVPVNRDVNGLDENVYTEIGFDNIQSTGDVSNNEYNTTEQRTADLPEHSYEQTTKRAAPFIDTQCSPVDKYLAEKKSRTMGNTYLNIRN